MTRRNTLASVYCALFAALIGICSQILIPLPSGVPINLALLAVVLCGALLPLRYALFSVLSYILLGMVGVPVFTGLAGGVGVLFGRTGGYILGYVPCALITNLWCKKLRRTVWLRAAGMSLGILACYGLGTGWFMQLTGMGLGASLAACVLPFVAGDVLKVALAAVLTPRLQKALKLTW